MSILDRQGVNSKPLRFVDEDKRSFVLFETYMMECDYKRQGYEDARLTANPPDTTLSMFDGLKYEEGRCLYAELKLEFGEKLPKWLSPKPPTKLVRLCLTWSKRHPGEFLLPPTFKAAEATSLSEPEKVY